MTADRRAELLRPLSPEEYDACPVPSAEQLREARERGRADRLSAHRARRGVKTGDMRPLITHRPCSCCGTPLLDRPLRRPVRDIRLAWGDCYVLCARCEATP